MFSRTKFHGRLSQGILACWFEPCVDSWQWNAFPTTEFNSLSKSCVNDARVTTVHSQSHSPLTLMAKSKMNASHSVPFSIWTIWFANSYDSALTLIPLCITCATMNLSMDVVCLFFLSPSLSLSLSESLRTGNVRNNNAWRIRKMIYSFGILGLT